MSQAKKAAPQGLNVSLEQRVRLAQEAGFELNDIADCVREQVQAMITCETHPQETVIYALLDRAKIVADVLMQAGTVSDDHDHNAAEMAESMRIEFGEDADDD